MKPYYIFVQAKHNHIWFRFHYSNFAFAAMGMKVILDDRYEIVYMTTDPEGLEISY